jgi:hypothetical protein
MSKLNSIPEPRLFTASKPLAGECFPVPEFTQRFSVHNFSQYPGIGLPELAAAAEGADPELFCLTSL